jgi:hypothetical protein
LALALNIILVPTLVIPTMNVIVAMKLATEHRGTPEVETIRNRILKEGKSSVCGEIGLMGVCMEKDGARGWNIDPILYPVF